ncbi:MAG TPA: MFS transporter [Solirubrobacteraceae bacterium]|nr:MFS transporter [Solirubrobacteraceae bacterium]
MSLRRLLGGITADLTPLRRSPELRALITGSVVSNVGSQAGLVALPYQIYVETHSALLTGLLGAAELGPLVTVALVGGALADHYDRRKLLLLDQIALVACAAALCAMAIAGDPPVAALFVVGGLAAGAATLQNVARAAIVPNLVDPPEMPAAIALSFGLTQLTMVIGPGLGGLLISATGVEGAYAADALSCLAMVGAVMRMRPQRPAGHHDETRPLRILASIGEGMGFVRSNRALLGSFAIDLAAMTFGMPRALFPVLSVSIYHAGAGGTGLLFAAVSAGATVAALTTSWLDRARRLGAITIVSVLAWGVAIAIAGLMPSIWPAAALLAAAGAADSVSAVCRSVINQSVTPDEMRGRMSSAFSLVVTSGPRLGDVESGTVAAATSARFAVVSGGIACIVFALLVVAAFPSLAAYDKRRALAIEGAL